MYYEERWIDGKFCWRTSPNGAWTAYTANELAHRYQAELQRAHDLQRALDAEREKVKSLGDALAEEVAYRLNEREELVRQLAALRAQLAALTTAHQSWTKVLGEWLWNCTNLLGDYHIKTVQDFNEEVNRRIAWLMQHLDHTLPPPMTDEERDRIRKLSEDNAALRAENARLREAVVWALGYTDFRAREHGEGPYWWRVELRLRSKLTGEQIDATLAALQPERGEP